MARALRPSATLAAAGRHSAHRDPLDLATGELEGPPPAAAVEAAIAASRNGGTRYGAAGGLGELRMRVAQQHEHRNRLPTPAEAVLVTAGGKQALALALQCLLEPGDEVVIPTPAWPTFGEQAALFGALPVAVPSDDDLLPDPDRIEAACTPATRMIVLNSPSNPTGRVLPATRLGAIVDIARRQDLWIVSDEVYSELVSGRPAPRPLGVAPDERDRIVVVDSCSKRFAMAGLRVGFAIGPSELIASMTHLAGLTTTHASVPAQHAALAALGVSAAWDEDQRARLADRRNRAAAVLAAIPGVRCPRPEAGPYVFPDVRQALVENGEDDRQLADRLAADHGVLVVPGSVFGSPGHLRLCIDLPDTRLDAALARLTAAIPAPIRALTAPEETA